MTSFVVLVATFADACDGIEGRGLVGRVELRPEFLELLRHVVLLLGDPLDLAVLLLLHLVVGLELSELPLPSLSDQTVGFSFLG